MPAAMQAESSPSHKAVDTMPDLVAVSVSNGEGGESFQLYLVAYILPIFLKFEERGALLR